MKSLFLVAAGFLVVCGCDNSDRGATKKPPSASIEFTTLENGEPSHVAVQHILIAFDGSLPGKPVSRSQKEAKELATELLRQANAGADFDELVKTYTDDKPPGIYQLANFDQRTDERWKDRSKWIVPRTQMVRAFSDVSFDLEVGEIGMTEFNRPSSPFGWHIIKRIK